MVQKEFAEKVIKIIERDSSVIGLAVGGSWLTNEIDEFSDLDLILVTQEKITGGKDNMLDYARRFGNFLSGFTGEHVGEPRVLICLYENPLLHVDIKFLTPAELHFLVEKPIILFDRDNQLSNILSRATIKFPYPDYQWIEDRFWIWTHYGLLKIGRGEYLEAYDFLGFLRMVVLGPLLHIKNNNLPRGVRKVETQLSTSDFSDLKLTIPEYDRQSLINSLKKTVDIYRQVRAKLYNDNIHLQTDTELAVMKYLDEIELRNEKRVN